MQDLKGRVAVVTGGASGIGKGIAARLGAAGMMLVLADVERPALDAAVAELRAAGARVLGAVCDVAQPASVESLAQQAYDEFGAVHVLCNNAGVAGGMPKPIWEQGLDDWSWVLGVNLMGVVHGVRSFLPRMLAQGGEGHVVNTASMAGLMPGSGIYGVSKHAVVALSESLSNELMTQGSKIRVSVLCPGWVSTRILESERNRPEAPREAPGPLAPQFELARRAVAQLIASGLDPEAVGDIVVEAIRAERFYVLTHPTWMNMVENRMQNILQGRAPIGVPPPGASWPPAVQE
jgi:NAD(P)-dependent dehydrogenase (short-subunit alcohol dehydrogenase family)